MRDLFLLVIILGSVPIAFFEPFYGVLVWTWIAYFNPHRYTLEEGGMKRTDDVQLAFKRQTDPQGLLNPGKMIAWENPAYDYRSGKPFLFKGLQKAG